MWENTEIRLVTSEEYGRKLVSEPNNHTTKHFNENLMAIEMRKTKVKMNKPVYLGQAILDISKTLMYEFYYDYLKPKYKDNVELCYMDTDSFILDIKTEDFFKDIADDVPKWFDTFGYSKKLNRPLPTGLNEKVPGMFKDELNGNIMLKDASPKAKTHAHVIDTGKETKKAKGTGKVVTEKNIAYEHFERSVLQGEVVGRKEFKI